MSRILKVTHNAGFFSCCTIRLMQIIEFFNTHGRLPDAVDSSEQWSKYKTTSDDLTYFFFKEFQEPSERINGCHFDTEAQFLKYETFDFDEIKKFISLYFEPSDLVKGYLKNLETKYNLDYENLCSVFYRGNDKSIETNIGDYDTFFEKVDSVNESNPNIKFLVQTDEKEFLESFLDKYDNVIHFVETPVIPKSLTTVHDVCNLEFRKYLAAQFLAATISVSKCKYLISHTGNCGLWAFLYRGNAINTYQYLDHDKDYMRYKGWIIN